jgi:hypothetical protein
VRSGRLAVAVVLLCAPLVPACHGDGTGPDREPHPLQLSAQAHVDSATFAATGTFELELVPYDDTGARYVEETWQIGLLLGRPASAALAGGEHRVVAPDTVPSASAVLVDDSGSMLGSDPQRNRAAAAQLFWQTVLPARSDNLVALLDFGRGDVAPSPGFGRTRLLQTFTTRQALLDANLTSLEAVAGGGTHLYQSGGEVARWMDSTLAPATHTRSLVLLTDGQPGDTLYRERFFTAAAEARLRVYAVGLGAAADPQSAAARLVQELATRTGGVYGAASSPDELASILSVLASAAGDSRLLVEARLTPIPPSGTPVEGSATVAGAPGTATAPWTFTVP